MYTTISLITGAAMGATLFSTVGGTQSCNAYQSMNTTSMNLAATHHQNIVETAVAAGNFSTLAKALTEAGLVDALQGDGPFTVFAPTDEAFAKLPSGTVERLLRPENRQQLISILTYHVVPGDMKANDVLGKKTLTTLNGQRVDINKEDASINGVSITKTDINCSNGTIHVIDEVIMPQSDSILDIATSAGSFNTLAAALEAADLIETLQGDGPFTVFAPTDDAFASLPEGTVEKLLKPENKEKLRSILLYHVVEGRVYADQAVKAGEASTVQGDDVSIRKQGKAVRVNGATVQSADIKASNGVIHVIDRVILPQG